MRDSEEQIPNHTSLLRNFTFEDIVWEIFDETYPSGLLVLQYCVGGYSIKLAIFFLLLLLFFLSLNNNSRTGFNVKIVSEVCNSDNNLGCGGSYVQRTIPHLEAVAQSSSSGPD